VEEETVRNWKKHHKTREIRKAVFQNNYLIEPQAQPQTPQQASQQVPQQAPQQAPQQVKNVRLRDSRVLRWGRGCSQQP